MSLGPVLQARRTPTGASPSPGTYGSPGHDLGAGKPMVSKPPSTTPDNLRLCSMSVDLERADVYDACDAYPASPSDQQVSATGSHCCSLTQLSTPGSVI